MTVAQWGWTRQEPAPQPTAGNFLSHITCMNHKNGPANAGPVLSGVVSLLALIDINMSIGNQCVDDLGLLRNRVISASPQV